MPEAVIGKDAVTGELITIGDLERRSGLYILGITGTGKSALMINLMRHDFRQGHGVFFLDAHGDAIEDLLTRSDVDLSLPLLLDPEDKTHTFGLNLLACRDIANDDERHSTHDRALAVFENLFEEEWGPLLGMFMPRILDAFIENQDYTLADVPRFLDPTEIAFRNYIVSHIKYKPEVADFWRAEFKTRRPSDQQSRVDSALTRVNRVLEDWRVRDIVGQRERTIDFAGIIENRRIVLVRLSANIPPNPRKFIGTMLISELVRAALERPPDKRHQYCVFVDEFHTFAGFQDFARLINEERKFGVATTYAHQERFGQFADNKAILGATEAAANKVFFRTTVTDAKGSALEFAKAPPSRPERGVGIAQYPVAELLRIRHPDPEINEFVDQYLRRVEWRQEVLKEQMEAERLERADSLDQAALSRVDERREAIYVSTAGGRDRPIGNALATLDRQEQAIEQARAHTANLLILHERIRNVQQLLRYLNYWLVRVMEGRLAEGQEDFSRFIIAWVESLPFVSPKYTPVPASHDYVLKLYLSLVYGDPTIPRTIPFEFAKTKRLFTDTVTALQQEVERTVHLEQEMFLQVAWEPFDSKLKKAEASWQTWRQERQEGVWKEISASALDFGDLASQPAPYFLDGYSLPGDKFLQLYNLLFEYPSVAEILKPYYTARFARPWAETLPNYTQTVSWLFSWVRFFRRRSAMALQYFKFWNPPLRSLSRFLLRYTYMPEGPYRPGNCPEGMLYELDFLDEVEQFVMQYREGAVVVLVLLMTLERPTQWRKVGWQFGNETGYFAQQYNMLYVPIVANREPFDILLLLGKLADVLSRVNHRQARKYTWYCPQYFVGRHRGAPREDFQGGEYSISNIGRNFTSQIESLEQRDDMRKLHQLLAQSRIPLWLDHWWPNIEKLARTYLMTRACNIARYGQKIADLTFPQPTFQGIPPAQVAEMVAFMAQLLEEEERHQLKQREQEWRTAHESQVQHEFAKRFNSNRLPLPANLEPRSLSTDERKQVLMACHAELFSNRKAWNANALFEVINDFVRFCKLLRQPENHILLPSTHYAPVNARQYHDMSDEAAQELIKLPNYTAFAKVIGEQAGDQVVLTRKIQTLALPKVQAERVNVASMIARQNAIDAGMLRERRTIAEEIRVRRERWRRRAVSEESAQTKESTQGSDEPPPTSEEPSTRAAAPENIPEKRPANSAAVRQRCKPEVFNPRAVHWAYIKDDVLRIEQAQFGDRAKSEERFVRYLANPAGTHVLLLDTSNGRVVGYTLALPAEQVYRKDYYPERLAEISVLDAPTAYIVDTAIDPAYTGQHLVGPLLTTLEEALVKKGYGYLDRDVAVANNYAANTAKVYADRILASYLHDSHIGPQMFFRIRLHGRRTQTALSGAPARTDKSSPDVEEQSSADTKGNKRPKPEKTPPSLTPPPLQCVSLEFFESGKDLPKMEERQYNTRFPLSTARFINYEITLHNLRYKQGDQTRQWEVRYYNPDGTLEGTNQDGNFVTKSDCKTFCHSGGRGRAQPGHWKPGTYRLIIVIDGSEFAKGSFTIEEPPPIAEKPPASPALEFVSLQFFESDKDDLQKELLYRIWFPQETTRFVKHKLTVRNRLYKVRDQTCQVVDRYYKPDGSLWVTSTPYNWVIKSDRKETELYTGKGWKEPGHWEPGDYRVQILINGEEFAETKFKIQKPRRRRV